MSLRKYWPFSTGPLIASLVDEREPESRSRLIAAVVDEGARIEKVTGTERAPD